MNSAGVASSEPSKEEKARKQQERRLAILGFVLASNFAVVCFCITQYVAQYFRLPAVEDGSRWAG